MRFSTRVLGAPFLIAATAALIQPIHAQQAAGPRIRVTTRYTVRSDRTDDMAAAIKEYNAILKKAMWDKSYTIWRSVTGPAEMVRVDYHEKWAELDWEASNVAAK